MWALRLPSHSAWTDGMIIICIFFFVVFCFVFCFLLFSFCLVFVFVTVSSITIPSCIFYFLFRCVCLLGPCSDCYTYIQIHL